MSEQGEAQEWEALGARLRGVREYLNLSQEAVASATGIPRSAVSDIERGKRKVDSLELRKFARLYRYSVAYLLGEQEDQSEAATAPRAPWLTSRPTIVRR